MIYRLRRNSVRNYIRSHSTLRLGLKFFHFHLFLFKEIVLWLFYALFSLFTGISSGKKKKQTVYIVGWYGTETAGDKLILLGLLSVLVKEYSEANIKIASMNESITSSTIDELKDFCISQNVSDSTFSSIFDNTYVCSEKKFLDFKSGDILVLGGGPIMDDPIIGKWLIMFLYSRIKKGIVIIGGNGLGPIRRVSTEYIVHMLIGLAQKVLLRNLLDDTPWSRYCEKVKVVLDPAFLCFEYISSSNRLRTPSIAINLRSIPFEYSLNYNASDEIVIGEVSKFMISAIKKIGCLSSVFSLNNNEKGSVPDSTMSTKVIDNIMKDNPQLSVHVDTDDKLSTIFDVLLKCDFVVTTRFHGMIMALLSGCKVVALDYSSKGGKSLLFYKENGLHIPKSSVFNFDGVERETFVSLKKYPELANRVIELSETYKLALKS